MEIPTGPGPDSNRLNLGKGGAGLALPTALSPLLILGAGQPAPLFRVVLRIIAGDVVGAKVRFTIEAIADRLVFIPGELKCTNTNASHF